MTETTARHATDRAPWWQRLAAAWAWIRDAEPAMVQATVKGALGVALLWGIGLPADLEPQLLGTITAFYAVLALWQGKATRARVYAPATVEAKAAELSATGQVRVQVGPGVGAQVGGNTPAGPYPPA